MSSLIARCKTIAGVTGLVGLVGLALTHGLGVSSAIAAPPKDGAKDAEAIEIAKKAIYTDYLGTKFADAEKKLKQALALCEPNDACSAKVRAQLLCDLGVVYIGGMNDVAQGKSTVRCRAQVGREHRARRRPPLPRSSRPLRSPRRVVAAQGEEPAPPPPKPPQPAAGAAGDLVHTTISEQATLTPLPVYSEMPAATNAARMQIFFKPFGATEWKAAEMKRMGKGYGAEIPCAEVGSAQGELSYYIQAFDADKNLVSWSGSRSAPNKVAIRLTLTGEAPHLPGQAPPARCPDVGDCPPEFPGCHGKKTEETPPPCEPGAECNQPKPEGKKNWVSLAVQQDFLAFSGNKSTCAGPPASDYTCFDSSSNYYGGIPFAMSGDEIKGGLGVATTRILAGYDRAIGHFYGRRPPGHRAPRWAEITERAWLLAVSRGSARRLLVRDGSLRAQVRPPLRRPRRRRGPGGQQRWCGHLQQRTRLRERHPHSPRRVEEGRDGVHHRWRGSPRPGVGPSRAARRAQVHAVTRRVRACAVDAARVRVRVVTVVDIHGVRRRARVATIDGELEVEIPMRTLTRAAFGSCAARTRDGSRAGGTRRPDGELRSSAVRRSGGRLQARRPQARRRLQPLLIRPRRRRPRGAHRRSVVPASGDWKFEFHGSLPRPMRITAWDTTTSRPPATSSTDFIVRLVAST